MRYLLCALSVCLLFGCRNSPVPISNPFLSPDRVPPPATRTLLPGTAQPYYPGDPVPNSPAVGLPAPAFTPGTTYSPAPATYPSNPVTPTTPPGGWNGSRQPVPGSPPRSPAPAYGVRPTSAEVPLGPNNGSFAQANEPPVRVQGDNESLRFAPTSRQFPTTPTAAPPGPAYQAASAASAPARMPIQTILPSQFSNSQPPTSNTAQLTGHQTPAGQQPLGNMPQQVQMREITQAELQYNNQRLTAAAAAPTRDGFRPQGSRSLSSLRQQGGNPREQATNVSRGFGPVFEAAGRFGYEPQYQWLRGQLQYSQATNQWKLRYIPIQGNMDQFGGSVLLANPHLLGNLRPGDYVLIRGRLQAQETDVRSFAPVYTISVVQQQRQ